MKTKISLKKIALIISCVIISIYANAQIIAKTLNVTVYATEQYEGAKQNLYALSDSCQCKTISLNEIKTENGNQKITIELAVNNDCFKIIDKRLPFLGYISFKNLKTEDKSDELDTTDIKKDIIFLKEQKTKYSQQLAKIKSEDEQYKNIWQQEAELDTKIYEKEKLYLSAIKRLKNLHTIQITICE